MNRKISKQTLRLSILLLCGLLVTAMLTTPALSRVVIPQQVTAFLSAPYYDVTELSSVFDHNATNSSILAFNGDTANRWVCPCRPTGDCADPSFDLGYFNCNLGRYIYYDNHNGIDYKLRYGYVRTAASGTVARANWANTNHKASYGLHVRIDHDLNGDQITDYQTVYGHMSVLRVQMGDEILADADEFARIIGISGNTGWSSGPHLHFEVRNANGTQIDPYGPDRNPAHKLWIERPSIAPHVIYTSGSRPLTAPPIVENETGYFTVDDGDAGFAENPAGCWKVDNTTGWANDYRHRNVPDGNCTATWNFPQNRPAGRYNVFVHVPNFWDPAWPDNQAIPANRNATVDAAQYTITHTVSASQPNVKQGHIAVVNQWAYPNGYHRSPWVYIGTYYFNNQFGVDYVRLESQAMDPVGQMRMTADAMRFSPVVYRVYLPLTMKRWPPIPDTPVLNAINNPNGNAGYTVSWQAAYLANTYTLQEATNVEFNGAVMRYSGTGTSWTASGKVPGTYYYRVKATNSWGDSDWSNIQQTLVWPTTTTFYSVADSTVQSGYPTANNGSSTVMLAGCYGGAQVMRGLVRFDLSGIPSGTPISQAQLWLYLSSSREPMQNTARTIATYRVASAWTENSVTWNTRPSFAGIILYPRNCSALG